MYFQIANSNHPNMESHGAAIFAPANSPREVHKKDNLHGRGLHKQPMKSLYHVQKNNNISFLEVIYQNFKNV